MGLHRRPPTPVFWPASTRDGGSGILVAMARTKGAARVSEPVSTTVAAAVLQAETERRAVRIPGKRVAVVPLAMLRKLKRLAEDALDNRLADEALAEPGPSIPWERAKRELGV